MAYQENPTKETWAHSIMRAFNETLEAMRVKVADFIAFRAPTAPANHRTTITAQDASDPTVETGFIDASGYGRVSLFVLTANAVGLTKLTLRLVIWNPTAGKAQRGAKWSLTDSADLVNPVLTFETRGRKVWCKVEEMAITSGSIDIQYSLS